MKMTSLFLAIVEFHCPLFNW